MNKVIKFWWRDMEILINLSSVTIIYISESTIELTWSLGTTPRGSDDFFRIVKSDQCFEPLKDYFEKIEGYRVFNKPAGGGK